MRNENEEIKIRNEPGNPVQAAILDTAYTDEEVIGPSGSRAS